MASIFCDSHGMIIINYLEQGRTINDAFIAATPGNRKKEARNPCLRCSALTGQRLC